MTAKATTRVPEEEFAKMIEDKVSPLGEKLDEINIKLTKDERKPKDEKIEDIIKKIREKSPERIVGKEKEKLKEEVKDVHDEVDCPTCGISHVHKVVGNRLTLKCNEDKCGEEFVMLSKSADHICLDCGLPLKKPAEDKKIDECPWCHGTKAIKIKNGFPEIKFDFTKMKK